VHEQVELVQQALMEQPPDRGRAPGHADARFELLLDLFVDGLAIRAA
jgi:hypothetical protein